MTKLKIISILLSIAAVFALGFWIFGRGGKDGGGIFPFDFSIGHPERSEGSQQIDSSPADQNDERGASQNDVNVYYSGRYTHPSLGFSFEIPEGFRVTSIEDERGEVILAEGPPHPSSPTSGEELKEGGNRSFQIFIIPFDEEGPLTAERIKKDLPKLVMKNVRNARIGVEVGLPEGSPTSKNSGVPAIVFESEGAYVGPTFEVWFVYPERPVPHGNYLYQITSAADFAPELSKILQTWRF